MQFAIKSQKLQNQGGREGAMCHLHLTLPNVPTPKVQPKRYGPIVAPLGAAEVAAAAPGGFGCGIFKCTYTSPHVQIDLRANARSCNTSVALVLLAPI